MSKLYAAQEPTLWGFQMAACRTALLRFTPILVVAVLAGCASKGQRASALDQTSSGGRGYNASAAHAPNLGGSASNSAGTSSTQAGASGKRWGAGAAQGGPNGMDSSASADGTANRSDIADDDSSPTDGASGVGGPRKPGARGRNGRSGSQAGGGTAEGESADAGTVVGADGTTTSGTKGKRGPGARRRGAGGPQGPNGESADMDAAGDEDADTQIAAIEVPNHKVEVNEDYQPLTLGGALPVVLGVNEEGRFDFDQYALRDEVKAVLDGLADTLKTAEYDRLEIFGYTDRIGAADYNRRLSELRAYAVAQYLMHRGVPESKIRYEGRGDKDPLTHAEECQGLAREALIPCLQKDRRVEIEASIHRKHATVVQ